MVARPNIGFQFSLNFSGLGRTPSPPPPPWPETKHPGLPTRVLFCAAAGLRIAGFLYKQRVWRPAGRAKIRARLPRKRPLLFPAILELLLAKGRHLGLPFAKPALGPPGKQTAPRTPAYAPSWQRGFGALGFCGVLIFKRSCCGLHWRKLDCLHGLAAPPRVPFRPRSSLPRPFRLLLTGLQTLQPSQNPPCPSAPT